MKRELKKTLDAKLAELTTLEKEVNLLKTEFLKEKEQSYDKYLKKQVKIVGQKGWNVGVVNEVRVRYYGGKCQTSAIIKNGKQTKMVPFENLEFLTVKEEKEYLLHVSISGKG